MVLDYGAKFNEGKVDDALGAGAKLALRNRAGGGYDQELFLPWKLITKGGAAPAAGSTFRVIFDLFVSGLEGNRIPYIVNARPPFPPGWRPCPTPPRPTATIRSSSRTAPVVPCGVC